MQMRKSALNFLLGSILLLLLQSQYASAQERILSGTVLEQKTGSPLEGATITIKGKTTSTITDASGRFNVTIPSGKVNLVISYVEFESQTIAIDEKQTNLTIKLSEKANKQLNDVVVVGYQEVRRKKTTAAISSVKGKEIENLPSPSFDQLLQGKVAGLNVQNYSGEPGARPTFVIRGNTSISRSVDNARALSSPLFVIDGIPLSIDDAGSFDNTGTNYIAGINPNDIESIDVLKDASAAAIYGSRGANGVVIIKTKRGKPGKPQVNVSYYTGISEKPELTETIYGAEERRFKVDYLGSRANYQQRKDFGMLLTDSLNPAFNNAQDWQGMFYQKGIINNADLSVSGAKDFMDYRVSANYYNEDGIIKGTGYKRYTVSAALGLQMTKKLKIESLFRLSRGDRSRGRGAYPWEPALPLSQGNFPSSLLYLTEEDKLNYTGSFDLSKDENINDDVTGSIAINYNFTPLLRLRSQGSIQTTMNKRDLFRPGVLDANDRSYASSQRSGYQNLNLETTLDYTKSLNSKHNFNLLLGNTINYVEADYTGAGGFASGNDNVNVVQGISPENYVLTDAYGNVLTGSNNQSAGLLSYFSRLSYDFREKYLFSVSWRADASSRFGKQSQWGYFPAVSAGWNLTEENFMEPTRGWLSEFKIRGSYGATGSLPGGYYLPFNTYSINQGGYGGSSAISYNGVNAVTPNFNSGVAQDGLTWEQSVQSNIGIDASFLNNRIMLSADAYNRGKTDILFDLLLPSTSGYEKVNTNAVSVRNLGVEFNLFARILNPKKDFQWNTRLIMSFNKNQIVELPNDNRDLIVQHPQYYDPSYMLTKGRPIYEFYLMKSNGVYSNDAEVPVNPYTGRKQTYWNGNVGNLGGGDFNWQDQNGDYDVWDWGDKVRVGNPNPRVTGGFTNTFSYKNFNLEVFTTFVLGREIFNKYISDRLYSYSSLGTFVSNAMVDLNELPTWKEPGDQAKYGEVNPYGNFYYQFLPFSSAYIEDGSYARIKYINLSYTFPKRIIDKLKMRNLQLYTVLNNVYTFQKSTVPDAEAVDELGLYSGEGYPVPRKITIGINVGF
jgi:TonB-linked SusC/RagA family outer membrane protein